MPGSSTALPPGCTRRVKIGEPELHAVVRVEAFQYRARDGGMADADGNSFEISDISLRLQLWKILRRDVVIKELTVDGVKVAWTQNAEGKWQMPPPLRSAAGQPGRPPWRFSSRCPQPASRRRLRAGASGRSRWTTPGCGMPRSVFTIENHKSARHPSPGCMCRRRDAQRTRTGAKGSANDRERGDQQKFRLQYWSGRFKYTPDELSLFDTSCTVGSGTATGTLDVKIRRTGFAFRPRYAILRCESRPVCWPMQRREPDCRPQARSRGPRAPGGDSRSSKHAQGERADRAGEQGLSRKAIFLTISTCWLHTDKFRGINLDDVHADFHFGGGGIFLDDLVVKSAVFTFTSQGAMACRRDQAFPQMPLRDQRRHGPADPRFSHGGFREG